MKLTEYNLGSLISIKHGFAFSGNYISQEDNGIVLVTPGNFRIGGGFQEEKCKYYSGQLPDEYILRPGDFIVTMTDLSKNADTLGYSAFVPNSNRTYLHNQRIGLVAMKSGLCDREYLYWLMRTYGYQRSIANNATGSTVKHTSPTKIYEYKFQAPEIDIQRRIAKSLSAYDDLIENNHKQIKLLEETAMRLYQEWFVNLRFPGYETTKIADGVPDGWNKYRFSEKVDIMSGGTPKTAVGRYYDGNIPFYTPKDSDGSYFSFDTSSHITDEGLKNCNSKLYPAGTVIITARGTVGKTVLLAVPMAMNQSCYALKCDELNSPYFLFLSLRTEVQKLKGMANGGVFDTIIVKTFDNINITFPTKEILDLFNINISPIMEQIIIKMKQSIHLMEARDILLPKLMSGEIEV